VSHSSRPHQVFSSYRQPSISSDENELHATYTDHVGSSTETGRDAAGKSTPLVLSAYASSPSTSGSCASDPPEATDMPADLNAIVIGPMMLERSKEDPILGTWDMSNQRTLEFTMSGLLSARN
jgi:hypothetical protein